ncbi:MAG: GTPase ObgE [candidate division KSB1 bacterium]|nr:GTPase ObgE [candidate division KSB1 bacterium]MDZ7302577.1 GTPase ObgE [candidate division KSB1 bacterium]MDZ7311582.1 GTPase ObgE [candidate division KSB1 bacterium]
MFIDYAKIYVEAGRGGSGCVSFRREKFVPKGGPDGGDGGKGGDVIMQVNPGMRTLQDFQMRKHFRAKRGEHGKGANKTGRNGDDMLITVPPGTVVKDAKTGEVLADLVEAHQRIIIARGGRGGRGNASFATSTNQAPRDWEAGELGESRWVILELKLLADVGLVGLPNAGKSTLLSRISAARPKIADYPFTTLSPNLGVAQYNENSFVVADIPGLIEGAHEGRGLGIEFLRHIERTAVLVMMIDATSNDWASDYRTLINEMASYNPLLLQKPRIVALTKMDLVMDKSCGEQFLQSIGHPACRISAVSGEGIDMLLGMMWEALGKKTPDDSSINATMTIMSKDY